jgi:hypothetical protein
MEHSTARFIRRENVKHYRRLLEIIPDGAEREKIKKLLHEEVKVQIAAGDPVDE